MVSPSLGSQTSSPRQFPMAETSATRSIIETSVRSIFSNDLSAQTKKNVERPLLIWVVGGIRIHAREHFVHIMRRTHSMVTHSRWVRPDGSMSAVHRVPTASL